MTTKGKTKGAHPNQLANLTQEQLRDYFEGKIVKREGHPPLRFDSPSVEYQVKNWLYTVGLSTKRSKRGVYRGEVHLYPDLITCYQDNRWCVIDNILRKANKTLDDLGKGFSSRGTDMTQKTQVLGTFSTRFLVMTLGLNPDLNSYDQIARRFVKDYYRGQTREVVDFNGAPDRWLVETGNVVATFKVTGSVWHYGVIIKNWGGYRYAYVMVINALEEYKQYDIKSTTEPTVEVDQGQRASTSDQ